MVNIATIIEGHTPTDIALIDGSVEISYAELGERVTAARSGLIERGLLPGQRVLLIGENEIDTVVGMLAVLGAGAVVAPIRSVNPVPEIQRKLASVRPDLVLLAASAAELLDQADGIGAADIVDLARLMSAPGVVGQPAGIVDRDADDLAFLMLTSGVSSNAKVAMLSQGNLDWMQETICRAPGMRSDDVALGVLPLSHIFGLNVVLFATLRRGGTVVLQAQFDVDESLRLIREHAVTTIAGAPPMWQRWVAADVPADSFATVEHAASGAAALSPETFEAVRDTFGIELGEGYGLTETSPIVTWSRNITPRQGSVGKPMDGVEVVLVDDEGVPVEAGDVGEVVVRSPGVFKGYLDEPTLTDAVLTSDGWFWTGDVGVFDADGYLHLVDRIKDIVIVSGFNVYPAEVEGVLLEHPDVDGAIVVGTPDGRTGEAVVANITGSVDPAELDRFCRERLSRYKVPTEFRLLDELPVAPTGKLIRRAVRP